MTQLNRESAGAVPASPSPMEEFCREIREAGSEAAVYSALVAGAMRRLGCERAAVVKRHAEGRLTLEASIGLTPAGRSWLQGGDRRGLESLLGDRPGESWSLGADPWGEGAATGRVGVGAYPIGSAGRTWAWLLVALDGPDGYGEDVDALVTLAGAAAGHLRSRRDQDQLTRVIEERGGAVFERVRAGEWVYRRVSAALSGVLGHPAEELESGRATAVGIKSTEDRGRCAFEIERAVASRVMRYTTEYRVVRADGVEVRVRESARVVETDGQGASRILGVIEPATIPSPMTAEPGAISPVFEEFPLGLCDVDLSGRVLRGNAALSEMLGLAPGLLAGAGLEDMLHADDLPTHRSQWAEVSAGRVRALPARVQRWRKADGTFTPLRVCVFGTRYLSDGRPIVRYVMVDGGEVATLREALRSTQAKLQSFFEQASVGMAEVSLDGRFASVNPRLCAMLGYPASELVGKEWQAVSHPSDVPRCEAKIAAIAAGDSPSFTLEKRYLRRDGSVVWGIVSLSSVRDSVGRLERFGVVLYDVTDRHLLQERLRGEEGARSGERVLRVLVVDDEPTVRSTLGALLAHNAFEAETAGSMAEARAIFHAGEPFDVVLCDAGLMGEEGVERDLAAAFPGATPVLMSGDPKLVVGRGALQKPFGVDDLTSAILNAAGVRPGRAP